MVYDNSQPVYEEAAPIVYSTTEATTAPSGTIYSEVPVDNTVITTAGTPVTTVQQPPYTNPYESSTPVTQYPDPYANGTMGSSYPPAATPAPTYPAPVASYPTTSYPATPAAPSGGIHLQIAALKDYYAAEEFKNSLSLEPGLSAYVQRGPMNKVIIAGIPSVAEANRLKETRFPGAFIVQGGSMAGYTPSPAPVPSYNTGAYTVNDPYAVPASVGNTGIGVQIGAFSSRSKAQSVADSQRGQYPAVVKKIGGLYKVILTGFPSRSAARTYAHRVGGFVVSL